VRVAVSCAGSRASDLLLEDVKKPSGHVHSVFQKAVNLSLETSEGASHISLLASDAHPYGLTCPDLPEISSLFSPGMSVSARDGTLAFLPEGPELEISGAPIWRQPASGAPAAPATLAGNSRTLMGLLSGMAGGRDLQNFSEKRAIEQIQSAADKLTGTALLPEGITALLSPLVGMGPGLTPLGDDFVSGYLTAARLLAQSNRTRHLLESASLLLAARDTTFYSKSQITFAGRGICLRSIFQLVRSMASPVFYEGDATRVLGIGATSGYGWALGIAAAAAQTCIASR
jgi:hypothetical protein